MDTAFLPKLEKIKDTEVLLYVNYFGIMQHNISIIREKYSNIIIDNAQAFYSKPLETVSTIYSPRKFFGLPDGGFVYSNEKLKIDLEIDKSGDRMSHLIARVEDGAEVGYNLFRQNDNKLNDLPLCGMSKLTDKLLRNVDFEAAREKRNENFNILHQELKNKNELTPIIDKAKIDGPMVYPFLKKGNEKLRNKLIQNKIFVAKYWPNVIEWIKSEDVFEKHLYANFLPLSVDQRYKEEEMLKIVKLIIELL